MISAEFDVVYTKSDNNGRGPGRVFSHQYHEKWDKIGMFCPNCGKQEVWTRDDIGDYYVGTGYMCLSCEHEWTIQGPNAIHPTWEQSIQRLKEIRDAVNSGEGR